MSPRTTFSIRNSKFKCEWRNQKQKYKETESHTAIRTKKSNVEKRENLITIVVETIAYIRSRFHCSREENKNESAAEIP